VPGLTDEPEVARLRAIVDLASDLLFVSDPATGKIIDVNAAACEALGHTRAELLTLYLDDLSGEVSASRTALSEGSEFVFLRHKNGRVLRFEGRSKTQDFGEGPRTLTVARDMTHSEGLAERLVEVERERRRAMSEAQMLKSGRLVSIGTLAAGVAHEINNPLAYVMGNLQYITRELKTLVDDPAELRQILDEASLGAERIRIIMRDLRLFSRADDEEHRAALDIHRALDSAVNLTRNEVSHRAQLFKDYGKTPPVLGNEARLSQVFVNLLINAAQAIPEGRSTRNEIRIRTGHELGMAYVEIKDTGGGISKENLDRIFDPFYTTKDVGEGTGLGLSICQGLIDAMDGEIHVESQEGMGTIVRVTMPLAEPEKQAPIGFEQTSMETSLRPAHIMLIDDEEPVARSLARLLGRHHVTIATSGRKALELLHDQGPFDLVLCDLMLPDVNGVEIYYRVRDADPAMAARFVFMTGGAFTSATRSFVETTTNPVVQKPFDLPHIEGLIRSFSGV